MGASTCPSYDGRDVGASDDGLSSVLVEFTEAPAEALFEGLSKRQRLSVMQGFYASRKAALVEKLEALAGVSVDDLQSGAALIVRGSPEVIASLTAEGGQLHQNGLSCTPNRRFDALMR